MIYVFSSVMPVKTGIPATFHAPHWTPALRPRRAKQGHSLALAFAGVTVVWGSSMLRKIMPVRGIYSRLP